MSPATIPLTTLRSLSRFAQPASRCASFSTRPASKLPPFPQRAIPTQEKLAVQRLSSRRSSSTSNSRKPLTSSPSSPSASPSSSHVPALPQPRTRPPQPEYELTFTCKPCSARSTHRISKQGYHHGSVLITCPECRNRHVISDHLNIFGDKHMTIEDLMRERGQLVKKGTLSEDGDLEFWEDGSMTKRTDRTGKEEGEKGI